MSESTSPTIALQDLPGLREKTERVSQALRQQLTGHLEVLKPIYAPQRIFGKMAGGKVEVDSMERAFHDLKEKYAPFTAKPMSMPGDFDANWLVLAGSTLELLPWEYPHEIGGRVITMTTPLRWVMNFKTGLSVGKFRASLAGVDPARPELIRQFVVNALLFQSVLRNFPGLTQLFMDLRYELKTETLPEFKGVPLVIVSSCLQTFRPADDLISTAVAFSGVPAFVELLDLEGSKSPRDLLKEKIEQILA